MVDLASLPQGGGPGRIAGLAAIVVLGGVLGGYAIHEHNTAQHLAADNAQSAATLTATQHQLTDLTAKVNALTAAANAEAKPNPSIPSAETAGAPHRASARHLRPRVDSRYKKLQAQLDAQGKEIEQTRADLAGTQGDLANTRTTLTGSIAHTHDELVLLEKKGERNYTEFDLIKSRQFHREGAMEIRLRKANEKHQYADLELLVDDRNLTQKHVNLYQPVMFYTPDSPQPVEVVINSVTKNHIHGYVSAPKYRQSELASMASASSNANGAPSNAASGTDQNVASQQPPQRQKLPVPKLEPEQ